MTNLLTKILAGAIGVLLLVVFALALSRAHLKTELAEVRGEAALCHAANVSFAAQVAAQNAAVERLKALGEERAAKAAAAVTAAKGEAQKALKRAAVFATRKLSGEACHAAEKMIDDYLKERP